jgi:hypothetical protein
MSMSAKMDRVRQVGFKLANDWFINQAAASTFVFKHQVEVCNSTPPELCKEDVIVQAWNSVKDKYLSIPADCVNPGDLVESLKEWE